MIDDCIMIIPNAGGTFDVRRGARLADHLSFDEMLGLVAQMTMPDERRALEWLRTPEEQKLFDEHLKTMAADAKSELDRKAGDDYPVVSTSLEAPCGQCGGSGMVMDEGGVLHKCDSCLGTGRNEVAAWERSGRLVFTRPRIPLT